MDANEREHTEEKFNKLDEEAGYQPAVRQSDALRYEDAACGDCRSTDPETACADAGSTGGGEARGDDGQGGECCATEEPPHPDPLPIGREGVLGGDRVKPEEQICRVDGAKLLEELRDTVRRYVVLPEHGAEALALWVLHTHAFHLRNVTAYVGIASPEKRCGKSTLLGVLRQLVSRAVIAANISPSAFFRVIEERRPTLLIDEADTFLDGNDEMRGILNSGYTKETAFVVRVNTRRNSQRQKEEGKMKNEGGVSRNKEGEPRLGVWGKGTPAEQPLTPSGGEGARRGTQLAEFSAWCPKAIAAIGRLPETLADRCIVITMQRKRPNEKCERLKKLDGAFLRLQCEHFVEQNEKEIMRAHPAVPPSLNDRAADIWEPLLVVADLAGGAWPEMARKAAEHLSGSAQETVSDASLLIRDLRVLFDVSKAERMFSRDIVGVLKNVLERPWNERRSLVTELWLSGQLRPYGIKPRLLRMGEQTARGYMREDFEEVFARYAPETEREGEKKEKPE